MRHVCSAAPPSSFFPVPRQRNQTCESSLSPPSHPSPSSLSSPIPRAISYTVSPAAAAADGELAGRRPESAPSALRSPPSALPDVMSRPHLPKDPAFPRTNGSLDGGARGLGGEIEEVGAAATVAVEQSPPSQSSSPSASSPPAAMSSCGQYMLHRVRKLDTLAGVAIKYGVEVKCDGSDVLLYYLGLLYWSIRWDIKQQHSFFNLVAVLGGTPFYFVYLW